MARGAAALMLDLKQRGMLEDTLILWTTEFGRMPCAQGGKGRDHNPFVFTNWLAGGGIRGGVTHGESDQWGFPRPTGTTRRAATTSTPRSFTNWASTTSSSPCAATELTVD